ncbi:MerR family transcriptional regulator [Bogoriella caseilytica]|uniref:DNA-binding transcriptional MerR regulator n=1 Tax=Bogoriella caseilytica TaxID=56055 RepID=A0A3N2BC12_9MICO|nr:MerR family transcriptional regulator [Bogoriella caseilytica]ROR72793.1 DNA-binding transcriptional MerR regulator [Bogoriella caseilytica]
MLSIGAFAQIGQVTHRMLRHWDAVGLLVPAHVDAFSGYRSYDPAQLERLHRMVALRQLGFGIDTVAQLMDEGADLGRLEGLLRARRAEVEREYRLAAERLADVERRLRLIEKEKNMPAIEIVTKSLRPVRLAARVAVVPEGEPMGPTVESLFDGVAAVIGGEQGALETPIAVYEMTEDGMKITAGYVYGGAVREGFECVDLPAVETAVCGVHIGEISGIPLSWQALHSEAVARGSQPNAPCRELYLRADESGDPEDFVVELQQPVAPVA